MSEIESFTRAARYHFYNPPSTWTVRKFADRNWHIVNAAGDVVDRFETKRAATEALNSPYGPVRMYEDRRRWYLGTSNDHRSRALTEAEQAAIATIKKGMAAHV